MEPRDSSRQQTMEQMHHAHVFSTFALIRINCCTRPWICEDFTCAKKRRRKRCSSSVWTGMCMPLFRTPLQESRDSQKSHDGNPAGVPTHVRAVGHQDCRVSSAMKTHKGNMETVLGTTLFSVTQKSELMTEGTTFRTTLVFLAHMSNYRKKTKNKWTFGEHARDTNKK